MSSRPTIADIARELNVSPSTVSRALRDHPSISEERKVAVRSVAEMLGFELAAPYPAAAANQALLVGCVVPSISNPFFAKLVEKLEMVCAENNCDVIIHCSGGSAASEDMIVERLISRRVDGVFFVPISTDHSALERCAQSLRTVVVTQQTSLCPSIGVDHPAGGQLVAEHFKELGCTSCLLVGQSTDWKFEGFRAYIENQRLSGFRMEMVEVGGWDDQLSSLAYKAIMQRFDSRSIREFDCVFGYNDLIAVGALHALIDLGRKVPEDVVICGFDDTPFARESRPSLTTVVQPVGQIVRSGFDLLHKLILETPIPDGERSFSLKPHLVVRDSSYRGP
jgi:Transcriptional regulators